MAQWDKLTSCLGENADLFARLSSFYDSQGFSMTLREDFAHWIEKQQWEAITQPDDVFERFLDEIRKFIPGKHVPFVKKQEYQKAIKSLENSYGTDPAKFVEVMKRSLKTELDILNSKTLNVPEEQPLHLSPDVYMRQRIKAINDKSKEVDWTLDTIDMLRQSIASNTNKKMEYEKALVRGETNKKREVQAAIEQLQKVIDRETTELTQKYMEIQGTEGQMIRDVGDVATEMIDEHLNRWKVFQKYPPLKDAPNAMKTVSLDSFENLFSEIFEALILIKQQLNRYYQIAEMSRKCQVNILSSDEETQMFINTIQEYINEANDVIKKLFVNCVLIEEQPPQTIKVETKSGKSREMRVLLRCLLNSPFLKFGEVTTEFRNEQELNPTSSSNKKPTKATINGGIGRFSMNNRIHTLLFDKLRVEGFRRTGNDEIVTEQKYGLRFSVNIQLSQMTVPIKVVSLPIIVCCHTSQECSAQASILWYNAFSTMDAKPFEVDRSVPWDQFKQILDLELKSKMSDEGRPGRGFSEVNFNCIRDMLGVDPNDDGATVSWEKFNKDLLPPKNKFSFWKWFLATVNLMIHHFRNVWNDGLIIGYMSKDQAAEMFADRPAGTFGLRFSSSYIDSRSVPSAGLSVVLVAKSDDPAGNGTELIHCQPFTSQKHFSHFDESNFGTMLQEFRVNEEHSLQVLYPDRPIAQAFSKYCSNEDDYDYTAEEYNPVQISFMSRQHNKRMGRNVHRLQSMSDAGSICSPAPSQHMDYEQNPVSPSTYPLSPQAPMSNMSTISDMSSMSEMSTRAMMGSMAGSMSGQNTSADEVTSLLQQLNSRPTSSLPVLQQLGTNQNNSAATFTYSQQWAVPESVGEVTVETRQDRNPSSPMGLAVAEILQLAELQ